MPAPLPIAGPEAAEVAEAAYTAVQGLTVLAAIPVVGLALWCDYFERHIEALKKAREERDPDEELRMVRLAFLVGAGYQLLLWGTTGDIRDHYPIYANLLLIAALIVQTRVQLGVELRIKPERKPIGPLRPPSPGSSEAEAAQSPPATTPLLNSASRAFLFSMLGGAAYLGVLLVSLRIVVAIAATIHATPGMAAFLLVIGSVAGILGGLALAFALGPIQVRSMFVAAKLSDPERRARVTACFERAGVATPELWVIRGEADEAASPTNAMIAGFAWGRGPFRQGLFVSDSIFHKLSWPEFEAVLLHEISHVKLGHLKRRFTYSAGLILCGCALSAVLIGLAVVAFRGGPAAVYLGMVTVFSGFVYALKRLGEQSRLHEIEADLEAVRLGAGVDDLCTALEKLDRLNGTPMDRVGAAHPATMERIHVLKKAFAGKLAEAEARADATAATAKKTEDRDRAA